MQCAPKIIQGNSANLCISLKKDGEPAPDLAAMISARFVALDRDGNAVIDKSLGDMQIDTPELGDIKIALSSVDVEIEPLFPDFVVYLGGHVPQTPYVTPCSEEMASLVVKHLKDLSACILKNHGCVTVGKSIKEAYTRTVVLESGAQIYHKAIQIGKPKVLSKVEIEAILNLDIEKYRQNLLQG